MSWNQEHSIFNYSGKHLNTKLFEVRIPNSWYSNGQFMGYVLCTRPTIWISDQCTRKQDVVHLSGIQMVRLSGIQNAFENQTIWHTTSFQPFEYQTSSVIRSPLYSLILPENALITVKHSGFPNYQLVWNSNSWK